MLYSMCVIKYLFVYFKWKIISYVQAQILNAKIIFLFRDMHKSFNAEIRVTCIININKWCDKWFSLLTLFDSTNSYLTISIEIEKSSFISVLFRYHFAWTVLLRLCEKQIHYATWHPNMFYINIRVFHFEKKIWLCRWKTSFITYHI